MTAVFETEDQRDVWARMQFINRTWLTGNVDDLTSVLHDDIILVFPGFEGRQHGKETIIAGYRDYCERAKILEYAEDDPHVDIHGETAVVTYRYTIRYEMNENTYRDTGYDLFVFTRENGSWLAIWRTLVPLKEEKLAV